MAAASESPNFVGTKNAFVVTWFTNQNCHAGVFGKFPANAPAADVDPLRLALLPDEPHAVSRAEAAAVALTRPVPVSNLRRDGPSLMFSVCIASSTLGSIFIADLQLSPLKRTRRQMLTITFRVCDPSYNECKPQSSACPPGRDSFSPPSRGRALAG